MNMSMGLETMSYTRYINYDNGAQTVSFDKIENIETTVRLYTDVNVYEEVDFVMPYVLYANGNVMPEDVDSWIDVEVDNLTLGNNIEKVQVRKYVENKGSLYLYAQSTVTGRKLVASNPPWDEDEVDEVTGELKPENSYKYAQSGGYYYIWDINNNNCIAKTMNSGRNPETGVWSLDETKKKEFEEEYLVKLTTTKSVKHNITPSYNYEINGKVDLSALKWNIVEGEQTWANNLFISDQTIYWNTSEPTGEYLTKTAYIKPEDNSYTFTKPASDDKGVTLYGTLEPSNGSGVTVDGKTTYNLSPWNASGWAFSGGFSGLVDSGNYYYQCNGDGVGVSRERTYYLYQKTNYKVMDGSVWIKIDEDEDPKATALYNDNGECISEDIALDDITDYRAYISNPKVNGENIYDNGVTYKIYNQGQFGYWYEKDGAVWYMRNSSDNLHVDTEINAVYRNIYGEVDTNGINYFYYNKYVHTNNDKNLYTNYKFNSNLKISYKTFDDEGKSNGMEEKDISTLLFEPKEADKTILVESARVSLSSSGSGCYFTGNNTRNSNIGKIICE